MSGRPAILVDFGTSRVKAALLDLASRSIGASAECPAPEPRWGKNGEVETDPFLFRDALLNTAGRLARQEPSAEKLWLCSEMHGFVLDDGKGAPLTPYVSWRDQRASRDGSPSTLARFERRFGGEFQRLTGMALRPGLPALSLASLSRSRRLPAGARFLSLPEWLVVCAGRSAGIAHETIAAASGLYDIEARRWSESILSEAGAQMQLSEVSTILEVPIGTLRLAERELEVFGGVGDMQAAMLGAGIPARAGIAVNLGTGSQVARAVARSSGLHGERRPYFGDKVLACVTHIPAGRALNLFSGLADGFAAAAAGRAGAFWDLLSGATAEAILAAPLQVDLNVFAGAWRFAGGGSITGLLEGGSSAEQLVASIARAWLTQYADAIALLDPDRTVGQIALAGGLARRIPSCAAVLGALLRREVLGPGREEETIAGLASLALGDVA